MKRVGMVIVLALVGCGVSEIERPSPAAPAQPPVIPGGTGGSTAEPPSTVGPTPPITMPSGPAASTDAGAPPKGGGPAPADAGTVTVTGPAPSGVAVMINGMAVPREKVIVILHIGHSNMAGRAQGPAELMPYFYGTDPHLWRYQKGGVWTPAKEWLCPDGAPDKSFPQGAGPGMALLRQALALAPDSYVVSIGTGKSLNLSASCWSFRKGGIFFNEAVGPALELKGKVTFGPIFVMLGYDGRTDSRSQNNGYIACLKGLAEDYREALGEPNLPFAFGDYEHGATGSFSPTSGGAPQVIAQLEMIPAMVPNAVLINTDGVIMQDNHHYNMAGHKEWSLRGFKGLSDKGLLPWAINKP
jgi:hypothetical protein